ncbi:MAG TPA: NAD-dependent epimerase/dehydratase family protein [Firmicutes bacterium]|nr:NAD-dependent epimerase/dehydratase family protein [Bacillota bacterium]
MKAIVTGGAGFIGSHLAEGLIEKGVEVTVIDDLSTGKKENIPLKAKFHHCSITERKIARVIEKEKPDYIFHLAAQMNVRKSVESPQFDAKVNILGSLNILEAVKDIGLNKFLFASSGGTVYGEQTEFPAAEKHSLNPLCPYGVAKLAVENYLYFYKQNYNMDYISLRLANIYGPRQDPYGEAGVIAIFATKLLTGEQAVINGDGKQTRDYVFVKDVVNAFLTAMEINGSDYFNIGTGIETDVNELFRIINRLTSGNQEEVHGPAKKGEQIRSVLSHDKIKGVCAWEPKVKLNEGLEQTVEWFRKKIKG